MLKSEIVDTINKNIQSATSTRASLNIQMNATNKVIDNLKDIKKDLDKAINDLIDLKVKIEIDYKG